VTRRLALAIGVGLLLGVVVGFVLLFWYFFLGQRP
jgi:Mg/Co/Ni transporter MgtE